jgi:ubiquinone/menaquinone biosynthesis C-methylase UbiE
MNFYRDVIFPRLCHLAMRNQRLVAYRRRVIAGAEGRVLEIGVGSGLNLPFYGPGVREIVALDPVPGLLAMAEHSMTGSGRAVAFLRASAEAIPLDTASIDSVVTTWTLCSVPEVRLALHELRRVLKPGGRLLFVEHGLAPDPPVRRWQHRLTPAWRVLSGGCHLNRPIESLVAGEGFSIEHLRMGYMPGPKLLTFMYEGSARP